MATYSAEAVRVDPGRFYFHKYDEMGSHNDNRYMGKVFELNCPRDADWVAMEKVHGAHFCIMVREVGKSKDGQIRYGVQAAKRTTMLDERERFMNFQEVLDEYRAQAISAFQYVQQHKLSHGKTLHQLSIHGELFGGVYPHRDVKRVESAVAIQKGLYYSNKNDFYAYDLFDGYTYIDYDVCIEVFEHSKLLYAEPMHRGPLYKLIDLDNTFNTSIPEKIYNLPSLKDNIAEGFVFKPVKTMYFSNGKRVIIKSKTDLFQEVDTSIEPSLWRKPKKGARREEKVLSPAVDEVWSALCTYITVQRLDNVGSKGYKGIERTAPLIEDAMKDFLNCHNDVEIVKKYRRLSAEDAKQVKKLLAGACRLLVKRNRDE